MAAEVLQKLASSLASIKAELQQWHDESTRNQQAIDSLNKRLDALSQSSAVPASVQRELEAVRAKVESLPMQPVAGGAPELRRALEDWHKESMQNTTEIIALIEKLRVLEEKTDAGEKVKKQLEKVIGHMDEMLASDTKFQELKNTISSHNDEFKDLYSTIGKEHVELDALNESVSSLQGKLSDWTERNTESLEEVIGVKKELAEIAKDLKSKDATAEVHRLGERITDIASRVESLQQQERALQDAQEQLVEFDRSMKELVRKAVLASMSRQEFEEELGKIESTPKKGAAKPAPKAPEPSATDMRAKMRELRAALSEEKSDESLIDVFAEFEGEIDSAETEEQKAMLWDNMSRDISSRMKSSIAGAKTKVAAGRSAGADVSKLNLLVAKADIGVVSFETAASMRNLSKTKEMAQKLSELKAQIDAEL